MADFRDHYREIQAGGASVVAVSVDAPEKSEALRGQLSLSFPILCDTERRVVRGWDIYNPREKGGIAKPAVFLLDRNRVVRYAAVDTVVQRVGAAQIVCLLQETIETPRVRRRVVFPAWSNWLAAIRNKLRR